MVKIGDRIAHLRKVKKLSQTELAKSIQASREAISKYERNEALPSVITAKKIANVFEVTLDYLVDESASASFDKETVGRLNAIKKLDIEDKKVCFIIMDAFLRDAKIRQTYS